MAKTNTLRGQPEPKHRLAATYTLCGIYGRLALVAANGESPTSERCRKAQCKLSH